MATAAPAASRIPKAYRFVFLYLEPLSILTGAIYAAFFQSMYLDLTHAASAPGTSVPVSTSIVMTQLANLYLGLAFLEASVLRHGRRKGLEDVSDRAAACRCWASVFGAAGGQGDLLGVLAVERDRLGQCGVCVFFGRDADMHASRNWLQRRRCEVEEHVGRTSSEKFTKPEHPTVLLSMILLSNITPNTFRQLFERALLNFSTS
jgi:hypothetical protein